jgi:fucose 4-O-acetylase-like acetyltransferase
MTIKKQLKHFEWIGKNSLGFLLVHQPIILVLIYSQKDRITTFSATNQLIIALLLYVVVVLLCIPSIWLIKNKLPFLIGQKKKIDIR